ncbi:MAG: purine-nucleoside phosphorylase [Alphaproteobacteria bacterium]|nr:purine-nucleoside phosphorylase [Alphaproteobacteria bacterium]
MASNAERPRDVLVAERLQARFGAAPGWALVLGSGLGVLIDQLADAAQCSHADLGLPAPGVKGHAGCVAVGTLGGARVALLSGRVHLYEGHAPADVVAYVRALARWGVHTLVLTNAAGSARADWAPGTVVRLTDHIDFTHGNPLVGPNRDDLGPRFPDLSSVYEPGLGARIDELALARGVALERGVYVAMRGPSFETPAEVRMCRILGADVIGMSTVPEAIAAVHAGLRVAAFSVVSNYGAGLVDEAPDHDAVTATVSASVGPLAGLLAELVQGG